jgi:sarcosine oxidase subunit alpha
MSGPIDRSRQPYRLAAGGRIDRRTTVRFSFDGKSYEGYAGDTLASALLANGVHMIARSFKYHRPRGILGAGSEDPAALVQIASDPARTDPNTRVTEAEIYEGLEAGAQNCWPSLGFDIGAMNDLAHPFLPAGFYYKTFMGPPGKWSWFEPSIRKAAGLGKAPDAPDPDHYESINRHCDVLVIGAGASGLMAALSAARSGARVLLAEESAQLGGSLLSMNPGDTGLGGMLPHEWVASAESELASAPETLVLKRTAAIGYYADNLVLLHERLQDHLPESRRDDAMPRQRIWRVRAKRVVLATGVIERPLVFDGNDRPGIMLSGAVRSYLHRYGVLPGRRALVFANNNTAWQTAFDLKRAGAEVAGLIDMRQTIEPELRRAAEELDIPVYAATVVDGTRGRKRIRSASVQPITADGTPAGEANDIECDLLAVSGGWSPNAALFSQSRGQMRYDETLAAMRPHKSWQAEASAGRCNGAMDLAERLGEGARAGAEAARAAGFEAGPAEAPAIDTPEVRRLPYAIRAAWSPISPKPAHKQRAFVDLQNDVTVKDLKLAVQEGYKSVEHAKRYTTTGMGTDQGKVVGVNAFGLLADTQHKAVADIGVTTYRQPWKPVQFGAIAGQNAGELFEPRRTVPAHDWHVANGAQFELVGDWLRPRVYPRAGESFHDALQRECYAARTAIGVLDASTLGKIDIRGKDAREFLNRVYTNSWTKLAPGRAKYGLMLGEDGMVTDDGVSVCLADDHFHMTTTTGGAAKVLSTLEDYLQTEWPDLDVYLTSVTEQWAVASICGPHSAKLVGELCPDIDPDPKTFKFMSFKDTHLDGIPVRVFRVSFSGELSYEINIAATYGNWLFERIFAAGAKYGATPYGTEGMHLLRAEVGFIIAGQDTDGTVTPHDLRMEWAVKKKGDFIGKRSLFRADTARQDRWQLVGLLSENPDDVLVEGTHLRDRADEGMPPVKKAGHVTSSYFSPVLKRAFALGLVERGGERIGETLYASWGRGPVKRVTVTETDFLKGYTPPEPTQIENNPAGAPEAPSGPYARGPLAHREAISGGGGAAALTPLGEGPRFILRGDQQALGATLAEQGVVLPETACTIAASESARTLWLGPDEWMILAVDGYGATLADGIRAACEGTHHQLVDVSDYYTDIGISGARSRDLLGKLTTLDMHPRAFQAGEVRGSMFERVPAVLRLEPDAVPEAFALTIRWSHADYLWCLLALAGREYGLPGQEPIGKVTLAYPD